jgi:hypothetical protein
VYSVPLYAMIQTRCPDGHRARVVAANNILNALFMVVAAGWSLGVLAIPGAGVVGLFLATGLLNLVFLGAGFLREPEFREGLVRLWPRR